MEARKKSTAECSKQQKWRNSELISLREHKECNRIGEQDHKQTACMYLLHAREYEHFR